MDLGASHGKGLTGFTVSTLENSDRIYEAGLRRTL